MRNKLKYIKEFIVNIITFIYSLFVYSISLYYAHNFVTYVCSFVQLDKTCEEIIFIVGYVLIFLMSTLFIIFTTRHLWHKLLRNGLPKDEVYIDKCLRIWGDVATITFILLIASSIFLIAIFGLGAIIDLLQERYKAKAVISIIGTILVLVVGVVFTDYTKNIK